MDDYVMLIGRDIMLGSTQPDYLLYVYHMYLTTGTEEVAFKAECQRLSVDYRKHGQPMT